MSSNVPIVSAEELMAVGTAVAGRFPEAIIKITPDFVSDPMMLADRLRHAFAISGIDMNVSYRPFDADSGELHVTFGPPDIA